MYATFTCFTGRERFPPLHGTLISFKLFHDQQIRRFFTAVCDWLPGSVLVPTGGDRCPSDGLACGSDASAVLRLSAKLQP